MSKIDNVHTCEEYVLKKLIATEAELDALQKQRDSEIAELQTKIAEQSEILDIIRGNAELHTANDGTTLYVSFDSVWSTWDIENFEKVTKFFSINTENDDKMEED